MRIAIVGSGIAGLAAARLLHPAHDIRIFEQNEYVGGHSNTVDVPVGGGAQPVDTGFIVYNERNYPGLAALFDELGVPTQDSDMSFAASIGGGRVEYAGDNLRTLFGQRSNLFRPAHYRMLRDILRFNRNAKRMLAAGTDAGLTLGDFLERGGYGAELRDRYLIPMAAAIWSCPSETMLAFPLTTFVRFFDNHGLLDVANRPRWRTVTGGSREHVQRLAQSFEERIRLGCAVRSVARERDGVRIGHAAGEDRFDHVILASHADQSLSLLADTDAEERRILGAFTYQPNRAVLHTDERLMPRRRRVWSSWNYLADDDAGPSAQQVSVTYWMNRLQGIPGPIQYFVTLNPLAEPRPGRALREIRYEHPVFDRRAVEAQALLERIQGRRGAWYCGAWCGYGFHEDGLSAGQRAARWVAAAMPAGEGARA